MTYSRSVFGFLILVAVGLGGYGQGGFGHGEDDHHREGGHSHQSGHAHHDDEAQFGENKAIIAIADGGERFKLAQRSIAFLDIRTDTIKVRGTHAFQIPIAALVRFRSNHGVYVVREGWMQLIEVELRHEGNGTADVFSKHLKVNETIVVSGTGFVRAAHLQASGKGGTGHVH